MSPSLLPRYSFTSPAPPGRPLVVTLLLLRLRRLPLVLWGIFLIVIVTSPAFVIDAPAKPNDSPLEWFAKQANAVWSIIAPAKPNDSPLEWFAKQANAVWSIIFTTTVIVVVTGAAVVVRREFRRTSIVIDPIDVPTDLAARGYTPTVVAQRIAVELAALQRVARVQGRRLEDAVELSTLQIDFTVPTAGISYRTLLRYVRQSFGRPEQRVRGEIVRRSSPHPLLQPPSSLEDSLRITLRTVGSETTPPDLEVDSEAQLPDLLKRAAFEIATLVDPYLIAAYWFRAEQGERRFAKTLEAVSRCLQRTPPQEHHRAYVTWGNVLLAQRKFADAEEKFRTAARIAPRRGATSNSHGNLLRTMRRFDAADRMYRTALRFDRRDAGAWSNLGNVCNDRRRHEQAIRCYRRALSIDPRFVSALSGWGLALWRLGYLDEAERCFSRAVDLDPRFGWSYINWARLLFFQHRYDDAAAKLALAVEILPADAYAVWGDLLVDAGQPAEARSKYDQSTAGNPDLGNGLAGLARVFQRQGRHAEAIHTAQQALDLNPYHMGAKSVWIEALRTSGHYKTAIGVCQELLEVDPYQATGHLHWGQALRALGNPREAIAHFKRAAQIDPFESWAWQSWGDGLMDLRRPRQALRKYHRAAMLHPWNAGPHTGMGQALFTLGRYGESLDEFRRACDVDPRAHWAHQALAQTLRRRHHYPEALERIKIAVSVALQPADALAAWGDILVDLSRYWEAQQKYEECLEADPLGVRGLVGIANVMRRSGRYPEAIAKADEALSIDRRDLGAWFQSIDALRCIHRYDDTLARCQDVLEMNPQYASAHIVWGQVLRERHRPHDAIQCFKRAIAIDPRESWALQSWGDTLIDLCRPRGALRKYREAIVADPWNSGAHVGVGNALQRLGRLDEALEQFRRACKVDPAAYWVVRRLLDALYERGQAEEAARIAEQALAAFPSHAGFVFLAARARARSKDLREAADIYRDVVTIDPRSVEGWRGYATAVSTKERSLALAALEDIVAAEPWNESAYRALASAFADNDQFDSAQQCYRRGCAAIPESTTLLVNWGDLLRRLAREAKPEHCARLYEEADTKFQQAANLDAWNPWPRRQRGFLLLDQGRPKDAITRFDDALRCDSRNGWAWIGKGDALARLKRRSAAGRCYRRALRYTADDNVRADIERWLADNPRRVSPWVCIRGIYVQVTAWKQRVGTRHARKM
jgi:tetratricopeptide (TPR) repeat protein